jgi:hypothetical protein
MSPTTTTKHIIIIKSLVFINMRERDSKGRFTKKNSEKAEKKFKKSAAFGHAAVTRLGKKKR